MRTCVHVCIKPELQLHIRDMHCGSFKFSGAPVKTWATVDLKLSSFLFSKNFRFDLPKLETRFL